MNAVKPLTADEVFARMKAARPDDETEQVETEQTPPAQNPKRAPKIPTWVRYSRRPIWWHGRLWN